MIELTADERAILRAADVIRARQATYEPVVPVEPGGAAPTGVDLERCRQMQREADAARRQEVADMKAIAASDPEVIPNWTPMDEHTGDAAQRQEAARMNRSMRLAGHEWFRCGECTREIRGDVKIIAGVITCPPCWAKHRLGPCSQCGETDRESLRTHFSDHAWRCERCAADPKPTGAGPRMVAIR
jgi:hypothetical protein